MTNLHEALLYVRQCQTAWEDTKELLKAATIANEYNLIEQLKRSLQVDEQELDNAEVLYDLMEHLQTP